MNRADFLTRILVPGHVTGILGPRATGKTSLSRLIRADAVATGWTVAEYGSGTLQGSGKRVLMHYELQRAADMVARGDWESLIKDVREFSRRNVASGGGVALLWCGGSELGLPPALALNSDTLVWLPERPAVPVRAPGWEHFGDLDVYPRIKE